ncbi:MAG: HD domain-containing protein [Eubacteriales bacterium]|nr:HD domain-containing protein [Eubacteriales bacterium]
MILDENALSILDRRVRDELSDFRYNHTKGVERAVIELGKIYMPTRIFELRAAALLHDIGKENTYGDNISLAGKYNLLLSDDDKKSPKTLHQTIGALISKVNYSEFVTSDIIKAISVHSTASKNMSLFDMLLYLADYIEDTRKYEFCQLLREKFFNSIKNSSANDYVTILYAIILESLNYTIIELLESNAYIHINTFEARNSFIEKLAATADHV